ncbi:MAG: TetR/AcrR family transcriptional regulator [Clostridiales bacterium]|nr:TetR/AcrR family transcriptional regulator [Clostridiales bacterium]
MEKVKKIDKRSLRTRSLIKKAVIVLLKKKRPNEIAVTEVTKIALISRNSFYTHYNSILDVLDDIFNDVLDSFDLVLSKYDYSEFEKNPYPCLKEISVPLIANSAFSEFVIFSKSSNSFVQGIINALTEKFYNKYLQNRGTSNENIPYMVNFLVAGSINFVYKWFVDGKVVPYDVVLKDISNLITEGIKMIRNIKNEKA